MANVSQKTIKSMDVGETGYVVPWAVHLIEKYAFSVDGGIASCFTASDAPCGTQTCKIEKTSKNTIAVVA